MQYVKHAAIHLVGDEIAGTMFGRGLSSCDGLDRYGPCCFNVRESRRMNMRSCSTPTRVTMPIPPTTRAYQRLNMLRTTGPRIGGVKANQTIELLDENKLLPGLNILANPEKRQISLLYGKTPLIAEFPSLNLDYFCTSVLLTLGGNNLELTVSLNPIDHYKMKCTLKPDIIIKERLVGKVLFACDWVLKCLVFGECIDEQTGKSKPFDSVTKTMLDAIGYKSSLELRTELDGKTDLYTGATWIEPESISVEIIDGVIHPYIDMRCFCETNSKFDVWTPAFADWFTDHFNELTDIFPVFNELRELIVANVAVKVLRHHGVDLFTIEKNAVQYLRMKDYIAKGYVFPDEIYMFHVFDLDKACTQHVSGGIVNKYAIDITSAKKRVRVTLSNEGPVVSNMEPTTPLVLTVLTELRWMLGSNLSLPAEATKMKDVLMAYVLETKIEPTWLVFYDDKGVLLTPESDIPSIGELKLKLVINKTVETALRMQMCRGMLVL